MPRDDSPFLLRLAEPRDVGDVHDLVVELAEATGMRHKLRSTPADYRRFGFSTRPAFQALLAERHKSVVGLSLFFYEFSTWLGTPGVYIQDLIVRQEHRDEGLGRRLIAETVRIASEHDATYLRLSVDANNAAAAAFYRALGLEVSGDERIFHAHGESFRRLGTAV